MIEIVVGVALLLFGRRLFWLFVAALGFAAGFYLTSTAMQHPPPWLALGAGLLLGVVGAVLAIVLQKFAIAIAGFLAGGRLALSLATAFVANPASHDWITFVIGGLIGAILLLALFDWALIILSSIEGARLVVGAMHLPESGATVALIALTAVGIVIQWLTSRRTGVLPA
jgi:hypothetical protein